MRAVVFLWIPRTIYPNKPPFFGGSPTWVYYRKIRFTSQDALKKYLLRLSDEFPVSKFKILVYSNGKYYPQYYSLEEVIF